MKPLRSPFFVFLSLIALSAVGCDWFAERRVEERGRLVAKAYDFELFENDLNNLQLDDLNSTDSAAVVRRFVDSWTREKATLYQATEQLSNEQLRRIDDQVEDYRQSLVLYLYEKELINQKLDTLVSDAELQAYYDQFPENFRLKEPVLKVRYLIADSTAMAGRGDFVDQFAEFAQDEADPPEELQDAGFALSEAFSLDGQWFTLAELRRTFPLPDRPAANLYRTGYFDLTDSLRRYLIQIDTLVDSGQPTPLEYSRNDVRARLLKKRQNQLLTDTKKKIYSRSVRENDIEINLD